MPTPITTDDPIFAGIASGVPASFLADVVNLIDRSPTLQSQINQLDGVQLPGGGTTRIALQTGAGNGANSSYHSAVINIAALSSYDDSQSIAIGGSTTPGGTELITPAGVLVGLLAYELGHWTDAQLVPIYAGALGTYTIEQAVATEFASEGKSGDNQYAVMSQIQQSEGANPVPSGMANGNVLFNITSVPSQDTQMLQQVATLQSQTNATGAIVSYLGSQFWNVPVDGGSFLSTMWNGYGAGGARDDLGIQLGQITNFAVSEAASGTLAGCTIQTEAPDGAALTYQITCSTPGQQQAQVSDSSTHAVLAEIGTVIDSSGGMQVAVSADAFSFTVPVGGNAMVQGDDDTLTLSPGASLNLTGSGDTVLGAAGNSITLSAAHALVCAAAGSTTVNGANATTTVFGGAGDVDYAGGGILVMGAGAASVTGGAADTVFGGAGGLSYQGGQEYADVIGGSGTCTIHAGTGGGWYGGGSQGANVLFATGAGTVLDAGGDGDTLTGAAGGGAYLIAGAGNETLRGGNQVGETSFFLGSGADLVSAGAGGSVIDTGPGTASVFGGGGIDQIWGGSGGADLFTAGIRGSLQIYGFRLGIDHLGTGGQQLSAASQEGGGTLFTLSSGATILLTGIDVGTSPVFT